MTEPLGYLLDTNALSESRKKRPNAEVIAFLVKTPAPLLYLSSLSLGEFAYGAELKRKSDADAADAIHAWISGIEIRFGDRILPADKDVGRLWGIWSAQRSRPVVDTLIAATASIYGLTLVTRNVADVQDLPVKILNPWLTS